jgi:hypothetical protein
VLPRHRAMTSSSAAVRRKQSWSAEEEQADLLYEGPVISVCIFSSSLNSLLTKNVGTKHIFAILTFPPGHPSNGTLTI